MERSLTSVELKYSLEELLNLTTMTIATVGIGCEPHSAAVYFACDDQLNMYFFSDSKSQHAQDTANEVLAAVTVHPDRNRWQDIHGLQMRGAITVVQSQTKWQEAWKLYLVKFPFAADLEQLVAINQLYVFNPQWIRLVDNRRGFGFKQEWGRSDLIGVRDAWNLITGEFGISGGING
jgi:uncharacterized protein YhbP (UPF0306 family)